MDEMSWKKFTQSGNIMDYLSYRGAASCGDSMQQCSSGMRKGTGEELVEPDNGNGNGAETGSFR